MGRYSDCVVRVPSMPGGARRLILKSVIPTKAGIHCLLGGCKMDPRLRGDDDPDYSASLRLRIALTWDGLALPFVAAMAFPTSELNAFSLPALYSATIAAFAASTSSTMLSIAPESEICRRPLAAMIASASPSPIHMAVSTSFAPLLLIVPLKR